MDDAHNAARAKIYTVCLGVWGKYVVKCMFALRCRANEEEEIFKCVLFFANCHGDIACIAHATLIEIAFSKGKGTTTEKIKKIKKWLFKQRWAYRIPRYTHFFVQAEYAKTKGMNDFLSSIHSMRT